MAAPNDSNLARIRVSTTMSGTYAIVGTTRSGTLERGSENDTTLRWLGGEAQMPGDRTLAGTMPVWWDDLDTLGQSILETAWNASTAVWLQFAPKGVGTGAKVYQFQAFITAAPLSFDSAGEAVEGSFSFKGTPSTLTTVTLP
jgi:hypothetical protein